MPKRQLDHSDILILNILQKEADISNKDLSRRIALSTSTTFKRVNRLKKAGLLPFAGYRLNRSLLGYSQSLFLRIFIVKDHDLAERFNKVLSNDPKVETAIITNSNQSLGNISYRIVLTLKSDDDFNDWIKNLHDKHQIPAIVEKEEIVSILKHADPIKLSYQDLSSLRKLESHQKIKESDEDS